LWAHVLQHLKLFNQTLKNNAWKETFSTRNISPMAMSKENCHNAVSKTGGGFKQVINHAQINT
jgi:tripartite-type tricarboxylate transporter receptor subunit TctC